MSDSVVSIRIVFLDFQWTVNDSGLRKGISENGPLWYLSNYSALQFLRLWKKNKNRNKQTDS